MTFETMNWDTEANRIGWAFGFDYLFEFVADTEATDADGVQAGLPPVYHLRLKDWLDEDDSLRAEGGFHFAAHYSQDEYCFSIIQPETLRQARIRFSWQGEVIFEGEFDATFRRSEASKVLAHALFHLDLLTPEIEALMGAVITTEERNRWAFEYEARHAYEKMDWPREAKRIAMAFGIDGECEWSEPDENTGRKLCLKNTGIPSIQLTPTAYLWVDYYEVYWSLSITNRSEADTQSPNRRLTLMWDWQAGPCITYRSPEYIQILRKGLFHLDLLTPEIEAFLKTELTAHERMEWTLEYETRNGL